MFNQKIAAYIYILFGLLLIILFGGDLLLKLLGIMIGMMFLSRGLARLGALKVASHMNSTFFSNDDFR